MAPPMNRPAPSYHRKVRDAFTLVELLVVIAIIAVLAGLLLPVMSGIRARGDSITCTSNLRQIGAAIGSYVGDNDGILPGPVDAGQMPTYTSTSNTSLAFLLAKYLNLPTTPTGTQTAAIFLCPAYAKLVPKLDSPVYRVADISNAIVSPTNPSPVSPFGVTGGGQPWKLSALTGLADHNTGNAINLSSTIAIRDYVGASATLVTNWVTWSSAQPVHRDHVNVLYYDWHVGAADPNTLQPK
jgi:prepilin-type N-terminal cleavage/methylation domain-containing protein/prepilin-type processing-associated H-X9-DG protein